VHQTDFFRWAEDSTTRFDCVVGNPPFIRYQQFKGETRTRALSLASRMGASFPKLTSSWAPFVIVAASLLKPGGRLAFVVPAEIGHATYAPALIEALCRRFSAVSIVAIRDKLFPDLSQDAWLLHADGYGGTSDRIRLSILDEFAPSTEPPRPDKYIPLTWWEAAGRRLRKFLLRTQVLTLYQDMAARSEAIPLGRIADVGIGYVSGANEFFHLSPAAADLFDIPQQLLRPAVRRGEQLTQDYVDTRLVKTWLANNKPVLLLDLTDAGPLPKSVRDYLNTEQGTEASRRYKCRVRDPWYVIPGLHAPQAFVTYMSGREPRLAINHAGALCTNSVLAVDLRVRTSPPGLLRAWRHPLSRLSQELEGHPLGGGMLKLEPGEARHVVLPLAPFRCATRDRETLEEGVELMRSWRHYDGALD